MNPSPAVVIAALAVGVTLAIALRFVRVRRQAVRRMEVLVARLDERPVALQSGGASLEGALSRLERAADRANTRLADARAELDRLAAVLDAVPLGLVVADETGQVILRNTEAARFTSTRYEGALTEQAVADVLSAARAGESGSREVQLVGPPRRVLVVQGTPLGTGGATDRGAVGAVACIQDVSQARLVENMRRDFVANVSHELKTPVGALVALTEALRAEENPEVAHRLADRVRHEAERLERIVSDLLDLSLIEAQEAPRREPVVVRSLLEEAIERVRPAAERAGVDIVVDDVPGGAVIACDRGQMVSAVANLLDNAVKYSSPAPGEPPNGPVEVGARGEDDRVVMWVRDRGIGIPERDRERIFERFYRVDRARSRASGGTGLGLAIVRHVAQAHGGSVTVESVEGEGSTFFLSVPGAGA